MAFGQTLQEPKKKTVSTDDGSTPNLIEYATIPLKGGNKKEQRVKGGARRIRILPELDENGVLVRDSNDNMQASAEVRFVEVWMDVNVGSGMAARRIILDWRNPFKNPYWERIAQPTDRGSKQRKAIRQMFVINVLDKTPVLYDDAGNVVYPDENGAFVINGAAKFVDEVHGKPTPLNKIRILEGSAGDKGGRHFLQSIFDEFEGLEDSDGNPRQPHEVDLIVRVTGIDTDTRRTVRSVQGFTPIDEAYIYAPRYDLVTWAKPWPNDAINALIDGAEFNEVIETFGIQQYPELKVFTPNEDSNEEPVTPVKKAPKKKLKETEEVFDD